MWTFKLFLIYNVFIIISSIHYNLAQLRNFDNNWYLDSQKSSK